MSIKTGRVIAHVDSMRIADAKFVVRPAGRARVLKEKRKNVHAFVVGDWLKEVFPLWGQLHRVSYDPYAAPYFVSSFDGGRTLRGVKAAGLVVLTEDGAFVMTPR